MRNYGQPQPIYGQPMGNPYNSLPQMPQFGMSAGLNWNGGYPQIGGSAGYYPYPDYGYGNPGIEVRQKSDTLHLNRKKSIKQFPLGL